MTDHKPEPPKPFDHGMKPEDLTRARYELGEAWGLGRPLQLAELARALRVGGKSPRATVRDYERGKTAISGPVSAIVDMLLDGAIPADGFPAARGERRAVQAEAIFSRQVGALSVGEIEDLIMEEAADDEASE